MKAVVKYTVSLFLSFSFVIGMVACDKVDPEAGYSSDTESTTASGITDTEGATLGRDTEESSIENESKESSQTETVVESDTNPESETTTETETTVYEPLATINGVSVSEYRIVCESEHYGLAWAAERLAEGIYEFSGVKPDIEYGTTTIEKTFIIKGYDPTKGEYFVESYGDTVFMGGSGINGPQLAVTALLRMIEGKATVELEDVEAPSLVLDDLKEQMGEGKVSVGFIGDSVTFGHGSVTPWPTYFMESLQDAYPDVEFRYENVAVSGKKSTWAAENVKKLLLKKKLADVVFVAIGTNDKYKQGALEPVLGDQSKENYISVIEQIREVNPKSQIIFVLCSRDYEMKGIVGEGGEISPYIDAMLEVSCEYGVPIIDPMSALYVACEEYAPDSVMNQGWRHYMQDEVHPNEAGQRLYAETVFEHFKSALRQ